MNPVDVAIVGGGPAGAATARGLAAAGREVVLLERSCGPQHKVCGEFLSGETCERLACLAVDARALGAVAIDSLALSAGGRERIVPLPFPALSLSRFRLDEALLARAEEAGADIRRGVAVRSVERTESGWGLRCGDGEVLQCRRLVLATGKHAIRGADDIRDGSMVGLKMHVRPSPGAARSLAGRVALILLEGGYAGIEPIEDGIANLCVVLPRAVVARLDPGWPALHAFLAERSIGLAERLKDAMPLWEKPLAVVCPSGGHLRAPTAGAASDEGVFRVGDRLAHIPPFTGDGLAIALSSAALAVEHILARDGSAAYERAARRMIAPPVRWGRAVSWLACRRAGPAILSSVAAHAPGALSALARRTRIASAAPR